MTLALLGAGLTSGIAAFDPASYATLVRNYDFSLVPGSDGDAIASVSGVGGGTAVQATGARQPLLKKGANGINNLNALLFDGSNDGLDDTGCVAAQPSTIYAVVKSNVSSVDRQVVDGITTRQAILVSASVWAMYAGSTVQSSASALDTTTRVVQAVFNGASSVLYLNNASVKAANPGTATLDGLRIGTFNYAAAGWSGLIGQVLVYTGAHSLVTQAAIYAGLKAKWGAA